MNQPNDNMMDEKIFSIMKRMMTDVPNMFITDARFKEMVDSGELVNSDFVDGLDDDAKEAYEAVDVYEEGTGKGWGMRYRRRSPLEVSAMRKEGMADSEDVNEDMFETVEDAAKRAAVLGCEGTHRAGSMFMPCATHEEFMELTAKRPSAPSIAGSTLPDRQSAPAAPDEMDDGMKSAFLCGFQRKSVESPCDFCKGGCVSADGVLGLGEIETLVKSLYDGSSVLNSGYSSETDVFVVDVKRADGSCIEVFMSGDGDELGWLRIAEDDVDGKAADFEIISKSAAEELALEALTGIVDVKGEVMAIMPDVFEDTDVYVVEIEADSKSYDFFVSIDGKVLGFDEYEFESETMMTEEDEIKALEAELATKRLYSRERRMSMAESGEAMEDGSFPIADEADLSNAIQAHGRAADVDAAKAHIMKRAKELGLEEMIPEEWSMDAGKSDDADLLNALEEFMSMVDSKE